MKVDGITRAPRRSLTADEKRALIPRVKLLNADGYSDRKGAAELDISPDTYRAIRLMGDIPAANRAPHRPEERTPLQPEPESPECPVCEQPVDLVYIARRGKVFGPHQRLGASRMPCGPRIAEPCPGGDGTHEPASEPIVELATATR